MLITCMFLFLPGYVDQWKKEKRSAVLLHLPVPKCELVKPASELGFTLHHTCTFRNQVVLSQWLDDSQSNKLPPFASHRVSACG